MSKAQRDKGKRWEREVAAAFRNIFGDQVHRGWQARSGSDACDVEGIPGYWIECKVGARPNPLAALDQAEEAQAEANDFRVALAVCKKDRSRPTVTLRFDDFLQMIESLKREGVS